MRSRLNKSPLGTILSFSKYINMVFEEPLVLHHCAQKNEHYHWLEHLNSFEKYLSDLPPTYSIKGDFFQLRDLISTGLKISGFDRQSEEIFQCKSEDELNYRIVKQYSEDSLLYSEVNTELRNCHIFQSDGYDESQLEEFAISLAPWILQLNSAIRKLPTYEKIVYRGADLKNSDIDLYKVGEMFVWAPFISASKSREFCLGGNVLFEITTESAMSLNDKRFSRDISNISDFPEEQEVLYPVACAYRILYKRKENDIYIIGLSTVDYI